MGAGDPRFRYEGRLAKSTSQGGLGIFLQNTKQPVYALSMIVTQDIPVRSKNLIAVA